MGRQATAAALVLVVVLVATAGACTTPPPSRPSPAPAPASGPAPAPAPAPAAVVGTRTSGCTIHGADPDPACTPGTLNRAVTTATIGSTICVPGYTGTIRPPVAVSEHLKVLAARAYGYTGPLSAAEGDHLVPLELGGNPESGDDISNFWDEPHLLTVPDGSPAGSAVKDGYENWLHGQVCRGRITLADAQGRIQRGWYQSFVADGRP